MNGPGTAAARQVLRVADLSVHYDTPEGPVKAVQEVSFTLNAGERLALVGESGSGKTTLATALLNLTRPPGRVVCGEILLDGRGLTGMGEREMRALRLSQIALIPQGAMNALNPVMRIGEQILDGITAHEGRQAGGEASARVDSLLRSVGLHPEVASHFPHELSGGMKQRVVIAIATALEPKVILADEPTSALDVVVQRQIVETLVAVQERIGAAVILIGHDMGLVAQFAQRVGLMYAGRLIEMGGVEELFREPRHPYTRMLIESLPSLESKREFTGIPGLPPELLHQPPGCAFRPRCPQAFEPCGVETPAYSEIGPGRSTACHLYPGSGPLPAPAASGEGKR